MPTVYFNLTPGSISRWCCANCNCALQARPAIAGLFFTTYVAMVFLVCMNMIIGIVTLYFEEVSPDPDSSDSNQ